MKIKLNLVLGIILTSLIFANPVFAETKTFIKEYTYMASDIDSKVSSRAIALEQVKRALLEQLGTYLLSETEVKNYQTTKDQITTLTAGIVSAEVIDEKWDGRTYYLKAKMTADPKEVAKSVDALRTNVQKSKELEDSKKKAEEAMREVTRLKKELELVNGLPPKKWTLREVAFDSFHAALDSYTPMLNVSSYDYRTLPRTQICLTSRLFASDTARHGPALF